MYLKNIFLLSAIIGLATCVRVFDLPESRGPPENHIDRNIVNESERSPSHVTERIKSSKNIGARNKIPKRHSSQQLEKQSLEKPYQKTLGSEEATDGGLDAWLKKLRSDRQLPFDGDRVHFQIQGHKGPRTYIFGYDTGHGKNRQFRLEEMSENGTVMGQYGYYDSRGKLRTVEYIARPSEGYKERHHENSTS